MRARSTYFCLALSVLAITAACVLPLTGCASLDDPPAEVSTTIAPTTTTTLSEAQVTLDAMTVRQKVAQVLMFTFSGTTLQADTSALLAAGPPGGLLLLGYNITDPAQLQLLTTALQQTAASAGLPVGLLIAVDQEGGKVQRIKVGVPALPSARTLGTESTPDAASELARLTARALLDQGVNMNLAPVADVVSDQGSFLFDRTYSGDPAVVSAFVAPIIQASQGQGLISVVKHFPGHGSASGNTHQEAAISAATLEEFDTVHLVPFRAAISAGVEGIMVAHVIASVYDAEHPATLSQAVVTGLLRQQLAFQGLVVTDDLSMAAALGAVPDDPQIKADAEAQTAVASLNAGCDLLIITELETGALAMLDALVAAVEQGQVSQSRLDDAVLRILDLKYRRGILAPAVPSGSPAVTAATPTTILSP